MCYDAIVFDNDGVLTYPTPRSVLRQGVRDAFAEFGVTPDDAVVDGMIDADITRIQQIAERYEIDPETLWVRRESAVAAAQRSALEDGRKTLYEDVETLAELAAPLGIVSNNQHETVESIVDIFDLSALFGYATGRPPTLEGFRRRKPQPDFLEDARSAIGVDSALYVGDSNVDVLAADRAGMDVAFIRRPHRADYQLVADPTYEIDSLEELTAIAV